LVLEAIISFEHGMYFVVPEDVPELTGKKRMVPGHVQSVRLGNESFQNSSQKFSYFRRGTRFWYSSIEVIESKPYSCPNLVVRALWRRDKSCAL